MNVNIIREHWVGEETDKAREQKLKRKTAVIGELERKYEC